MITIQQVTDYLLKHIADPVPKYLFVKEILKKPHSSHEYVSAYNDVSQSKWYRELADDQNEDGSWGSAFHGGNLAAAKGRKFACTEVALKRAHELGLSKDDPIIIKCIRLMERYVRNEESWKDRIEKHRDNGKGHLFSRPFMTAAVISMFDPDNPVTEPLRDVAAKTLKTAFAEGVFDEDYWSQNEREYHVPGIVKPNVFYGLMLMQKANYMDDTLQKHLLDYTWSVSGGIYYVSSVPPSDKQNVDNKSFDEWLKTLELLSGFSLFPNFMKNDVLPHLLYEVERLINNDVVCGINCRYAESYRDKNKRNIDMILRIARILVKC